MPPLHPVPGVIKVAVKGKFTSGYNWANVMHWEYGGPPPTSAECAAFASDIYDNFFAQFGPLMVPQTSIEECIVTDLSSSTGGEGNHTAHNAGSSTADKVPGNCTFLISKTIFARYRGGHPRTYLNVGADEDLLDQGHWNGSFVITATTAWNTFVTDNIGDVQGSTTLGQECAVSYYETDYTTTPPSRVRRPVPVVYSIATDGYTGNAEIASQRRRIGRKR